MKAFASIKPELKLCWLPKLHGCCTCSCWLQGSQKATDGPSRVSFAQVHSSRLSQVAYRTRSLRTSLGKKKMQLRADGPAEASSHLISSVLFASSSRLHHTSWWCMFLRIVVKTVTTSSTGSELMLFTKLALFANFLWLDIIGLCPRAGPHSSSAQCQLQVCFFLFYLTCRSNSY